VNMIIFKKTKERDVHPPHFPKSFSCSSLPFRVKKIVFSLLVYQNLIFLNRNAPNTAITSVKLPITAPQISGLICETPVRP